LEELERNLGKKTWDKLGRNLEETWEKLVTKAPNLMERDREKTVNLITKRQL